MSQKRRGFVLSALAIAGAFAPIATFAQTQTPRLPSSVEPRPAQPPRQTTAPRADFEFSINTPRTEKEIDATVSPRFAVKDIVIDGAGVFSRDDLKPLFEGLLGREASLAEIAGVATQIERRYRAAGYLLAQAFVPRQRVRDQIFNIKVVEGAIANVLVEGAVDENLRGHLVRLMAPITLERPITQDVLMRALMLANDLPGVTATGVLRAAVAEPGAADLVLAVEVRDQSYGFSVGNRGTRFQGPWSTSSSAVFNGLLGRTEQIGVALTATPDLAQQRSLAARYTEPLGPPGLSGSLLGSVSDGAPGDSLKALRVKTYSSLIGARVAYTMIRLPDFSLAFDGGLALTSDRVRLLDSAFVADDLRIVDVGIGITGDGFDGGFGGFRFAVNRGLPWLGATSGADPLRSRPGASGDFTRLSLDGRYQQPLGGDFSALLTLQAQAAMTPLPASQQFTLGGGRIGRGYDPSELANDSGWAAGLELRYDVTMDPGFVTSLQPFVFLDSGKVWSYDPPRDGRSLSSTGAGLRATFEHGVTASLTAARPLTLSPSDASGRHPVRILFDLAVSF